VYHYDARGSTIALTNDIGTLTDSYAYEPFGSLVGFGGSTPNRFAFAGASGIQVEDPNLIFMRARHYAPGVGVFLQRDLLDGVVVEPESWNEHAYCYANPISCRDSTGLRPEFLNRLQARIGGSVLGDTAIFTAGVLYYGLKNAFTAIPSALKTGAPISTGTIANALYDAWDLSLLLEGKPAVSSAETEALAGLNTVTVIVCAAKGELCELQRLTRYLTWGSRLLDLGTAARAQVARDLAIETELPRSLSPRVPERQEVRQLDECRKIQC
jgi:RHS repeat-associated protein